MSAKLTKEKKKDATNYRDFDMRLGGAIHAHSYHVDLDCGHASRTPHPKSDRKDKPCGTGPVSTEDRSGYSGPAFGIICFMGHKNTTLDYVDMHAWNYLAQQESGHW